MGWASGFSAGTRLGEAILKGQQRRAYEDIQSQKAEGSQGYTTDDAAQLEAAAQTGLYDIIPQYAEPTPQQRDPNRMNPVELQRNMTEDPRGEFTGYKVVPKAQMFQGQPVEQPEAGLVAPSRVTDFLGQRYAGDLSENRQVGLRSRALAEATVDPMERQRLLNEAIEQERKAVLAQREDELYPLQLKGAQQGITKSQLDIDDAQRKADEAKAKKAARSALSDWSKKNGGKQPSLAEIQSIASQFNIPATEFLTERDAANTLEYKELKQDFGKAITAGVSGMNKFLAARFDPDATDNISPQIVQDPKTKAYVVKYGDRVLSEYGSHKSFQELAGSVQGMIEKDPLSTIKTLAEIEASKAATAASNTRAAYTQGLTNQLGRVQKDNLQMLTDKDGNLKVVDVSRLTPNASGEVVFPTGFKPYKPKAFDPKAYSEVIKNYVTAGFSPSDAEIKADEMFGRSKLGDDIDYGAYAKQKATRGKGGTSPTSTAGGAAEAPPVPPAPAPVAAPTGASSYEQNQQQRQQLQGLTSEGRARMLAIQQAREILSSDENYNQLQAARTQAVRNNNRTLASRIDAKIQEIEGAVAQRFVVR